MRYKDFDLLDPEEARLAIIETMKTSGLSQKRMADRLDIHEATFSRIIRGFHAASPRVITKLLAEFPEPAAIEVTAMRVYVECPNCRYMATGGEIQDNRCPRCGARVDEGQRITVERIKL